MPDSIDLEIKLSSFLGIAPNEIFRIATSMRHRYKKYYIPKASGGQRVILHPCRQIKTLQYAINEILFNKIEVHKIAYAYIRGKKSPLKKSATLHSRYKYTIRIDFKNFFPSICPNDLFSKVESCFYLSDRDKILLLKICFCGNINYFLPIGAPTSPHISNIVMKEIDEHFEKISREIDKESAISRYADDLYFSTNKKGLCKNFYSEVYRLLEHTSSPKLHINEEKTLYLSKGTKRIVTGLYITPTGSVSIGRERKKAIKSLIYKNSKGILDSSDILKAQGMIAFIKDTEPVFYNRLAQKYGADFYSIKNYKQ